ncbi:MAG TPA: hypothetical protein VIK91_11410, partial [Nannocystis sp.]
MRKRSLLCFVAVLTAGCNDKDPPKTMIAATAGTTGTTGGETTSTTGPGETTTTTGSPTPSVTTGAEPTTGPG